MLLWTIAIIWGTIHYVWLLRKRSAMTEFHGTIFTGGNVYLLVNSRRLVRRRVLIRPEFHRSFKFSFKNPHSLPSPQRNGAAQTPI